VKHAPKESGDTIEDVIEFVWTKMYKEEHVNPTENDSDSEEDVDIVKTNESNNPNKDMEKENDGDASVSDREDNGESEGIVLSDAIINDDIEIPSDWFFPSFFSFVLFDPFVKDKERLALFEEKEPPKGAHPSRAKK